MRSIAISAPAVACNLFGGTEYPGTPAKTSARSSYKLVSHLNMSLGYCPPIKFQPDLKTRQGLMRIAMHHNIGANGSSENEVMKIVAGQFGKIAPENFFLALASLHDFRRRLKGQVRPFSGQDRP
jgi:hypothetical protein